MKGTGNNPRAWNKLRRTLKRSQLRKARKEAERQRRRGRGVSGGTGSVADTVVPMPP